LTLANRVKFGALTLAHLLAGRWKVLAKTDLLASGRNIFDSDDLTKKGQNIVSAILLRIFLALMI